jgi:hypothetical protein
MIIYHIVKKLWYINYFRASIKLTFKNITTELCHLLYLNGHVEGLKVVHVLVTF